MIVIGEPVSIKNFFLRLFWFRRRNDRCYPILFYKFAWFGVSFRVRFHHCLLLMLCHLGSWFFLCFCLVFHGIPVQSALFSGNCCILPFFQGSCIGGPVLLSTNSAIIFLRLVSVLFCLDFMYGFLFYFFVYCQGRWYGGLFKSTVITVLGKELHGCFQV